MGHTSITNARILDAQDAQLVHGLQRTVLLRFQAHLSGQTKQGRVQHSFVDRECAHQRILLVHKANNLLEVRIVDLAPVDERRAADRALLVLAREDVQERRLARARRAHDREQLTGLRAP